jgi:hypothetical protein
MIVYAMVSVFGAVAHSPDVRLKPIGIGSPRRS